MKDWKASVRTWERNGYSDSKPKATKQDESKWVKAKEEDIIEYPF